jgi:branched-chain amino acid transport system permease protein
MRLATGGRRVRRRDHAALGPARDHQLRDYGGALLVLAAALLAGAVPAVGSRYLLFVGFTFLLNVLAAQAWNLLAGYTGLLSLGNHAFVGVGAYTMAVVMIHTGVPLLAAYLLGGLGGAVFGVVTYLPLFRLRGGYFAISTLLLSLAVAAWAVNWKFIGENSGLSLPFAGLPSLGGLYTYAWLTVVGFLVVQWVLLRSRLGLFFRAVRDDQEAAETAGTDPLRVKLIAVAISAFASGLAGGLLAMQLATIQPGSAFSLNFLLDMVVMATVGGLGTLMGPVFGAVLIVAIQQAFQSYATVYVLVEAALLIVVVQVVPAGLMGIPELIRRQRAQWRRRRIGDSAAANS